MPHQQYHVKFGYNSLAYWSNWKIYVYIYRSIKICDVMYIGSVRFIGAVFHQKTEHEPKESIFLKTWTKLLVYILICWFLVQFFDFSIFLFIPTLLNKWNQQIDWDGLINLSKPNPKQKRPDSKDRKKFRGLLALGLLFSSLLGCFDKIVTS